MKKLFTILFGALLSFMVLNAQEIAPPQAFSYKASINKSNGQPIANKVISLRVSILQSSNVGSAVYIETFNPKTNEFGQIDIVIGRGYGFPLIDWSKDIYFLKTEVDDKGGTNYQTMSVTQLLSVPYALYSGESGNGFATTYKEGEIRPILSSGKVSIGTPPPDWPNIWPDLVVNGVTTLRNKQDWGTGLIFDASTLPQGYGSMILSTGGLAGEGPGKFIFRHADNSIFVMDKNRHVGINSTDPYNPVYTLDVGGDINFTGNLYKNGEPFSCNPS